MERLTYWNDKSKGSALPESIDEDGNTVDLETLCAKLAAYEDTGLKPTDIPTGLELANVYAALQRLKAYEDAEEQGLLVRFPCKVGQTVWIIAKGLSLYKSGLHSYVAEHIATEQDVFDWVRRKEVGKTVFLTKEAAEQALRERGLGSGV